jgi:AcrR family transcriptional regulator
MANKVIPRTRPGRPQRADRDDVRGTLLETARGLFARYGFRGVSGRQIAAQAGVNAAMIRYYFGGKRGLYAAMLDEYLAPAIRQIDARLAGDSGSDFLTINSDHARRLARNPWIAGLIVRKLYGSIREE